MESIAWAGAKNEAPPIQMLSIEVNEQNPWQNTNTWCYMFLREYVLCWWSSNQQQYPLTMRSNCTMSWSTSALAKLSKHLILLISLGKHCPNSSVYTRFLFSSMRSLHLFALVMLYCQRQISPGLGGFPLVPVGQGGRFMLGRTKSLIAFEMSGPPLYSHCMWIAMASTDFEILLRILRFLRQKCGSISLLLLKCIPS